MQHRSHVCATHPSAELKAETEQLQTADAAARPRDGAAASLLSLSSQVADTDLEGTTATFAPAVPLRRLRLECRVVLEESKGADSSMVPTTLSPESNEHGAKGRTTTDDGDFCLAGDSTLPQLYCQGGH